MLVSNHLRQLALSSNNNSSSSSRRHHRRSTNNNHNINKVAAFQSTHSIQDAVCVSVCSLVYLDPILLIFDQRQLSG